MTLGHLGERRENDDRSLSKKFEFCGEYFKVGPVGGRRGGRRVGEARGSQGFDKSAISF